uniref:hypothetical protein n=1 Tax=Methylobacterium sp. B34 TaxID=95563 RepID=UPI0005B275A8
MTAAVILTLDHYRKKPNGIVAPQYNGPMYVRNRMVNLDQAIPEFRKYKAITSIYPAADLNPSSTSLKVQWGAYDYVNAAPVLGPQLEFIPDGTNYKLDYISTGRFFDLRLFYDNPVYEVKISALDMD